MTALSEAIKAKLGIAEPLPKPELSSPSPGLSNLADDLKRSRIPRLLPKVTCPSPFHPRARTVPVAELQDVPVTETEKRGLSALAPLAGLSPSGPAPGGWKTGRPIFLVHGGCPPANITRRADLLPRQTASWNCRSSTPKICPNGQKNLRSFFC